MTDRKTVVYWLQTYKNIPSRIEHLKKEKDALEVMKEGVVSIPTSNLEATPIKGGAHGDPTYQAAMKLCHDFDRDIAKIVDEIDTLRQIRSNVDDIMSWISKNCYTTTRVDYELIRLRYFEGWSITRLCKLFLKDGRGKYHDATLYKRCDQIIDKVWRYLNT
jgi:hypothetical protein